MRKEHIEAIFNQALLLPRGDKMILSFADFTQCESARVRFITLKKQFEQSVPPSVLAQEELIISRESSSETYRLIFKKEPAWPYAYIAHADGTMTLVSPPTSTPPPPHESDITPLTFTDDEISKIRQQMSDDGYTVDEINEYIHDLNSSQKG